MKNKKINSLLYFGYNIEKKYRFPFQENILSKNKRKSRSESEIIEEGSKVLKDVFKEETNKIDKNKPHVVTLSGGLDGRAVLAGLLDHGLKDKITTVTFGTPGTWDYEIPSKVAESLDVKHKGIDLTKVNLTTDKLIKTLHKKPNSKWTFLIDVFYNHLINLKFGKGAVYWSGFDGALADCVLSDLNESFEQAKKKFVSKNKRIRKNISHPNFKPLNVLPKKPYLNSNLLSYSEQLNFGIRQTQLIEPICDHSRYDYRFPLLNKKWAEFMLNLPKKYRKKRSRKKISIYNKILLNTWDELFEIPTDTNLGFPLSASKFRIFPRKLYLATLNRAKCLFPKVRWPRHPGLNYLDFDEAIRERDDYNKLVKENLQGLKNRDILDWLDVDSLWDLHMKRKKNLGMELLLLAVLEINLKID